MAYLWTRSAVVASKKLAEGTTETGFYQSKLKTARFYFDRILPRNDGLARTISATAESLMDMGEEEFQF